MDDSGYIVVVIDDEMVTASNINNNGRQHLKQSKALLSIEKLAIAVDLIIHKEHRIRLFTSLTT